MALTAGALGFEGPEKKLEIEFRVPDDDKVGFRALSTEEWQTVLDEARCHIISVMKNEYCTAHVLSESSLFVFRHKIMVKTCGTTTLLRILPLVLEHAKRLRMTVQYVFFSRKSLMYPHEQLAPHTCFDTEIQYLNKYFSGSAFILGPITGEHWNVYQYDASGPDFSTSRPEVTLEMMMHELDPVKMKQFFRSDENSDVKKITESSGIKALLPGSMIDDFLFNPCGYSMNGIIGDAYWTIHITPEDHCSFVSFETTACMSNYSSLIEQVLDVFRPGSCMVALFADEMALGKMAKTLFAFERHLDGYKMTGRTYHEFEGSYNLTMCNFSRRNSDTVVNVQNSLRPSPSEERFSVIMRSHDDRFSSSLSLVEDVGSSSDSYASCSDEECQ